MSPPLSASVIGLADNAAEMPTTAPPPSPVQWDPGLLDAPTDSAVESWKRALHGFAKRLPPSDQARFLMALDSACYVMHGESATLANDGLHPKHRLLAYHDFFVGHIAPGESVIDLGSGVGALAASLARHGTRVTGMEWLQKNITKAQSRADAESFTPKPHFILGDITKDRAIGSFDAVILSNVLEHVPNREHLLRQWTDWYAPSRFLIRVPAFDRDWRVPWKKELGVEWRCDPTHETEYTTDQLRSELTNAKLRIVDWQSRWGEYWVAATPEGR